jgi:hypothetical protein
MGAASTAAYNEIFHGLSRYCDSGSSEEAQPATVCLQVLANSGAPAIRMGDALGTFHTAIQHWFDKINANLAGQH